MRVFQSTLILYPDVKIRILASIRAIANASEFSKKAYFMVYLLAKLKILFPFDS